MTFVNTSSAVLVEELPGVTVISRTPYSSTLLKGGSSTSIPENIENDSPTRQHHYYHYHTNSSSNNDSLEELSPIVRNTQYDGKYNGRGKYKRNEISQSKSLTNLNELQNAELKENEFLNYQVQEVQKIRDQAETEKQELKLLNGRLTSLIQNIKSLEEIQERLMMDMNEIKVKLFEKSDKEKLKDDKRLDDEKNRLTKSTVDQARIDVQYQRAKRMGELWRDRNVHLEVERKDQRSKIRLLESLLKELIDKKNLLESTQEAKLGKVNEYEKEIERLTKQIEESRLTIDDEHRKQTDLELTNQHLRRKINEENDVHLALINELEAQKKFSTTFSQEYYKSILPEIIEKLRKDFKELNDMTKEDWNNYYIEQYEEAKIQYKQQQETYGKIRKEEEVEISITLDRLKKEMEDKLRMNKELKKKMKELEDKLNGFRYENDNELAKKQEDINKIRHGIDLIHQIVNEAENQHQIEQMRIRDYKMKQPKNKHEHSKSVVAPPKSTTKKYVTTIKKRIYDPIQRAQVIKKYKRIPMNSGDETTLNSEDINDYSRDYSKDYSRDYSQDYSKNYSRNYSNNYSRDYSKDYPTQRSIFKRTLSTPSLVFEKDFFDKKYGKQEIKKPRRKLVRVIDEDNSDDQEYRLTKIEGADKPHLNHRIKKVIIDVSDSEVDSQNGQRITNVDLIKYRKPDADVLKGVDLGMFDHSKDYRKFSPDDQSKNLQSNIDQVKLAEQQRQAMLQQLHREDMHRYQKHKIRKNIESTTSSVYDLGKEKFSVYAFKTLHSVNDEKKYHDGNSHPLHHNSSLYLAWYRDLKDVICVKVYDKDRPSTKKNRKYFDLLKSDDLQRIRHENLCQMFFVEEDPQRIYVGFEYICGGSLQELSDNSSYNRQTLDEEDLKYYAVEIHNGLDRLHEIGIIHRMLSPMNVLLDVEGRPKIIDYQFATRVDKYGRTYSAKGIAGYMAPEIFEAEREPGKGYSYNCDWFSYGATLFKLLTRQEPYVHQDIHLVRNIFSQGKTAVELGRNHNNIKLRLTKTPQNYIETQIKEPDDGKWSEDFKFFLNSCLAWSPEIRAGSKILSPYDGRTNDIRKLAWFQQGQQVRKPPYQPTKSIISRNMGDLNEDPIWTL
ncbi:hypothetical protein SNEBB_009589 [Seison nebaliae]|nr:hypothetical protein SNEBB_009589 [Seison nebaliae]